MIAAAATATSGPIAAALDRFKADVGRYPTSEEGLDVLVALTHANKCFHGPYLDAEAPRDPWGNPYGYRCPGVFNPTTYDLWSCGPNGVFDGGRSKNDDIVNWRR